MDSQSYLELVSFSYTHKHLIGRINFCIERKIWLCREDVGKEGRENSTIIEEDNTLKLVRLMCNREVNFIVFLFYTSRHKNKIRRLKSNHKTQVSNLMMSSE